MPDNTTLDDLIKGSVSPTENVQPQVVSKDMMPTVGSPDKTKEQLRELENEKAYAQQRYVRKVRELNKENDIQNRIKKNVEINAKQYDLTPDDITEIDKLTREKYEKDYNDKVKGLVTDKAMGFEVGGQNHALHNLYKQEDLENAATSYLGSALGNGAKLQEKKDEFLKIAQTKQLNDRISGISPKVSPQAEADKMFGDWLRTTTKGYGTRKELDFGNYFDENGKPTTEFKKAVYDISGGKPANFKSAAKEILDFQYNKYQQSKSPDEQRSENMQNWLASNVAPAYWAFRNIQGMRKGAATIASTVTGIKDALLHGEPYGEAMSRSQKAIEQTNPSLKPATTELNPINEAFSSASELVGELQGINKVLPFNTNLFKTEGALAKYIPEIKNKIVRESASGLAQRADDILATTKLFGMQTFNDRLQYYHDLGYDWDKAKSKAATYTAANMAVLSALPSIIGKNKGEAEKAVNEIVSPTNKGLKDQMMQFIHSGNEAGLVMGASNILDEYDKHIQDKELGKKDANEPFNLVKAATNSTKNYASGFIFGVAMKALSGGATNITQHDAIDYAIRNESEFKHALATAIQNKQVSVEEAANIIGGINKMKPLVKEANEKGLVGKNAVQYATEKSKYDVLNRAVTQMEANPNADQEKLNNLKQRRSESAKDVLRIEQGTYLKGKIISGVEMAKVAAMSTPDYEKPTLTKEKKAAIRKNAPFVQEKLPITTLKQDENVAKNLRILENREVLQHRVNEYDKLKEEKDLIENAHAAIKGVAEKLPMDEKNDNKLKAINARIKILNDNVEPFGGIEQVKRMLEYNDGANNSYITLDKEGKVINGAKQAATLLHEGIEAQNVIRPLTDKEKVIVAKEDVPEPLAKDLGIEPKEEAMQQTEIPTTEKEVLPERGIKPSWESNIESLTHHETGLGAITKRMFDEQQPLKNKFLEKQGLTIDDYRNLTDAEKEELQKKWVNSDEFKELQSTPPTESVPTEVVPKALSSVNPSGTIFTEYNSKERAEMPLAENITTLNETDGGSADDIVTIYRGVPKGVKEINAGDYITTNKQLAKDYAGDGVVIEKKVRKGDILDDKTEPLGEEYIYRPKAVESLLGKQENVGEKTFEEGKIAGALDEVFAEEEPTKTINNEKRNENEGGKNISQKPIKEKTKLSKRWRYVSPEFRTALSHEVDSPYDKVLQYFIGGGKISAKDIAKLWGTSKGELKARSGYAAEGEPTINELAHWFWENRQDHDNRYDTEDFRGAIEEVVNGFSTRTAMAKEINERWTDKRDFGEEQQYWDEMNKITQDEDVTDEAFDILSHMTDEEIAKMVADEERMQEDYYNSKEFKDLYEEKTKEEPIDVSKNKEVIDAKQRLEDAKKERESFKQKITKQQSQEAQGDMFGKPKKGLFETDESLDATNENVRAQLKPYDDKIAVAQKTYDDAINLARKQAGDESQTNLFEEPNKNEIMHKKGDNVDLSSNNSIIGENATSFDKMISASSRFRPHELVVFNKPIIGENGNKLISYQWAYEWTMLPNREGELKDKRVSDWTQAENSAETGRDIVHKFTIERKDGTTVTVSSESVPSILGYVDAKEMKSLPSIVSSVKTLAKQRMQLAILKAQEAEYNKIKNEVDKLPKPSIIPAEISDLPIITQRIIKRDPSFLDNVKYWKTDGETNIVYRQEDKNQADKNTKEQLLQSWVDAEISKRGGVKPKGIYDLERRIERQEKKVEQATNSSIKTENQPSTSDKIRNLADKIEKEGRGNVMSAPLITPKVMAKALRVIADAIDLGADLVTALKRGVSEIEEVLGRKLNKEEQQEFRSIIKDELLKKEEPKPNKEIEAEFEQSLQSDRLTKKFIDKYFDSITSQMMLGYTDKEGNKLKIERKC